MIIPCKTLIVIMAGIAFSLHAQISTETPADWEGKTSIVSVSQDPPGAFTIKGGGAIYTKNYEKLNKKKKYQLSGEVKALKNASNSTFYFGLMLLDKDKRIISPWNVNVISRSDTELLEKCNFTDKTLKVKNASAWLSGNLYAVAFETAVDLSDLPNRKVTRPGINSIKQIEGGYEITLDNEAGFEYPAGTKVREHRHGASYVYLSTGKVPDDWKQITCNFTAEQLWAGSEYTKIIFIASQGNDAAILLRNVSMKEAD